MINDINNKEREDNGHFIQFKDERFERKMTFHNHNARRIIMLNTAINPFMTQLSLYIYEIHVKTLILKVEEFMKSSQGPESN